MGNYTINVVERLLKKIDRTDNGCWIWTGAMQSNGYGTAVVGYKQTTAHRHIYQATFGGLSKDLQLDHLCRNRACVNPNHLEPVSQRENILRGNGVAAINSKKTVCKNGHQYNEHNTYQRIRNGRPERDCKVCRTEAVNRFKERI